MFAIEASKTIQDLQKMTNVGIWIGLPNRENQQN